MTRTITPEQRVAMQAGKQAGIERRRAAAIERVETFRTWLQRDAAITVKRRAAEALGKPLPRRELMPAIPSPHDFKIADGLEDDNDS